MNKVHERVIESFLACSCTPQRGRDSKARRAIQACSLRVADFCARYGWMQCVVKVITDLVGVAHGQVMSTLTLHACHCKHAKVAVTCVL